MVTIDPVLQPLQGDERCGPNARYSPGYESIRSARERLQDTLPPGVWMRASTTGSGWVPQLERCNQFLCTVSKDLQVFAWRVEALYFEHGLTGLVEGTEVYVEAALAYWADIHPQLDGEDPELREGPMRWMLERWTQWVNRQEPAAAASASLWVRLESALSRYSGFLRINFPACTLTHEPLLAVLAARRGTLGSAGIPGTAGAAPAGGGAGSFPPSASVSVGLPADAPALAGALTGAQGTPGLTRERAYAQLGEIAAFLLRTEPHSPVAMILSALIEWRDDQFSDLLARLPSGGPTVYDLLHIFRRD